MKNKFKKGNRVRLNIKYIISKYSILEPSFVGWSRKNKNKLFTIKTSELFSMITLKESTEYKFFPEDLIYAIPYRRIIKNLSK